MNYLDELIIAEQIKFWTNTITLGVFRLCVSVAAIKYIWS